MCILLQVYKEVPCGIKLLLLLSSDKQTLILRMQIDCDKAIMVTLKHDDKLQDGAECSFQVYFCIHASCVNDGTLSCLR